MRTRIALFALVLVAVAGAALATVAYVQLQSTRHDLHALQRRVGHIAPVSQQPSTLSARLAQLTTQENTDISTLSDEINNIGTVCPPSEIHNYYTRLLGEQDAGVDVSTYLNLMDVICPDAVGDLRNQQSG